MMFTINGEGHEYAHIGLVLAAARAWMIDFRKSVTIYQNGEPLRLLRY